MIHNKEIHFLVLAYEATATKSLTMTHKLHFIIIRLLVWLGSVWIELIVAETEN